MFRNETVKNFELIFTIVKYLKCNFIVEVKEDKTRANFIIKDELFKEIRSTIDFGGSTMFGNKNMKLGSIIKITFQDNPNFVSSKFKFLDKDSGKRINRHVFKNLKRINGFQCVNDDSFEENSLSEIEDNQFDDEQLNDQLDGLSDNQLDNQLIDQLDNELNQQLNDSQ